MFAKGLLRLFIAAGMLAGFSGCSTSATSPSSESECLRNDDCAPGEVCERGECWQLCKADRDCTPSLVCLDGLCRFCRDCRAEPTIATINGTGSSDPDPRYASKRLGRSLVIEGTNLTGVAVDLSNSTETRRLSSLGTPTDSRAEMALPQDLVEGTYTLEAFNRAGRAMTKVTLLRGEPGSYTIGAGLIQTEDVLSVDDSRYVSRQGDTVSGSLSVGTNDRNAALSIQGTLSHKLTGTVSASPGNATVTGSGTSFFDELRVDDALRVSTEVYRVVSITSATELIVEPAPGGFFAADAFTDPPLLMVSDGRGHRHLTMDRQGHLGIGTSSPTQLVDVDGSMKVRGQLFVGFELLCNDNPRLFCGYSGATQYYDCVLRESEAGYQVVGGGGWCKENYFMRESRPLFPGSSNDPAFPGGPGWRIVCVGADGVDAPQVGELCISVARLGGN